MIKNNYSLEIPSDPNKLPLVEEFLEDITAGITIQKNKLNNLLLAVNEAISNAMLHGNNYDISKKVRISVLINDDFLRVYIKDEGRGFNPNSVPDPTSPENIFRDSGRGLYIMKSCMDEVNYSFQSDGTELMLAMRLD
ncbi:MAG: ATP-binding protein [Ignavibacteriales bacterium]